MRRLALTPVGEACIERVRGILAELEVVAEAGVPLVAGGWSDVLSRAELRSDQIHANAEGYKVFAERLAAWLREMKFVG